MNRSEVKYHNTAIKMYNALFELLEVKNFTSINVKELCEKANINRSTFYGHYDSMSDLLDDAKQYVVNDFFNSFKQNLFVDLDQEGDIEKNTINNYIVPYLTFIKKNKLVFKVFMENLQTFKVDEYHKFLLEKVFIPILTKKGIKDPLTINYISKYYLSGVTAIVMDWINRDCIDDISYMSDIILISSKYTLF